MPRLSRHTITLALLGGGATLWVGGAVALQPDVSFHSTPNPLGIKRSPYGEVVAMAMQGPIDAYWHSAVAGDDDHHACGHADCDHCKHPADTRPESASGQAPSSLANRFQDFLDQLAADSRQRTNSRSSSEAHKFYLRRQIEDKLRFAYELDPTHYGNYNSYHLFLTEPTVGTRPILTKEAVNLASRTIEYCLREEHDPRPALTAAAAASNVLEFLFQEAGSRPAAEMKQHLAVVDYCLERHRQLLDQAVRSGQWNLVSPLRQQETADRYLFLTRIRDAANATICRLEQIPPAQQASSRPAAR